MVVDDSFAEVWNQTAIRVTSPNEQIHVTIVGQTRISVAFAPGYYERSDADQLRKQLVEAMRAGVRGYVGSYWRLRGERAGHQVERRTVPLTADDAAYQREFERIGAEGTSSDAAFSCTMIGLREFAVTFLPSVLDHLDAAGFAHSVSEAATAMLHDQIAKAARLRFDIYMRPSGTAR